MNVAEMTLFLLFQTYSIRLRSGEQGYSRPDRYRGGYHQPHAGQPLWHGFSRSPISRAMSLWRKYLGNFDYTEYFLPHEFRILALQYLLRKVLAHDIIIIIITNICIAGLSLAYIVVIINTEL